MSSHSFMKHLLPNRISFPVLFFGIIIWPVIDSELPWKCREFNDNMDRLTVDCSYKEKRVFVPEDLNQRVQVLNLSGNNIVSITEKSFERYKNLIILDLSSNVGAETEMKMEALCFFPLKKLQVLDLSSTCFPNAKGNDMPEHFRFPESLKVFKYEDCTFSRIIDLTDMLGIEEFHGSNSRLSTFPIFNMDSPIRFVDLRDHLLSSLRILDIAPYCHLKEVRFRMENSTGLQHDSNYCHCRHIDTWLRTVNVTFDRLNCTEPKLIPPNCNPDLIDPSALDMRENCINKSWIKSLFRRKWFIFLMILVLALSIPTIIILIKWCLSKRKTGEEGEDDEDDREQGDGENKEQGDEENKEQFDGDNTEQAPIIPDNEEGKVENAV